MLVSDLNACDFAQQSEAARKRFTLDGDDLLEVHLTAICETVLRELRRIVRPRKLEALLLGGGYGRGEGGVLKTPEGDRPYNDLEFYVFIRGNRFLNRRRFGPSLNHLAHELTKVAGVEVEFHIISSAQLQKSKPSMFYYDLVVGHHQLHGSREILRGCEHHCVASQLPLAEATRLLMNRATGLLFARERLSGELLTTDDRDFIARNIAKAQLALGDAVLTVCGRYHWSCLERNRRLTALDDALKREPWFNQMSQCHDSGMEFKLHPQRSVASANELDREFRKVSELMKQVWLWTENRRLRKDFSSPHDYALSTPDKCPETNPWRNRLLNAWLFGPANLLARSSRRHPRERILNTLAMLLWDSGNSVGVNSVKSYQKIWERVR